MTSELNEPVMPAGAEPEEEDLAGPGARAPQRSGGPRRVDLTRGGLLRGIVKPGVDHNQAMDWLVGALRDCCAEARSFGSAQDRPHTVRIALEPICRYETTLINNAAQGLALLERNNPAHVLRRSDEWVFSPKEEYERAGDVDDVVFPCGWVLIGDEIRLYYGGADTCIALATASLSEILDYLTSLPTYRPYTPVNHQH